MSDLRPYVVRLLARAVRLPSGCLVLPNHADRVYHFATEHGQTKVVER